MLRTMRTIGVLVALAVVMSAGVARAATDGRSDGRKNFQLFKAVADKINRYDRMTIFDSVDIGVKDGVVTLTGDVTNPLKRDEIGEEVAKVDGVLTLKNDIVVL